MTISRRRFLASSVALGAAAAPLVWAALPELLPATRNRRVVIVGGGWAGLAAARRLRDLAPELEVVLLERNDRFWSCPLSNRWLAGRVGTEFIVRDYAPAAQTYGYTFIRAEVTAVERDRRRVVTDRGTVPYDWLVLASGIRYAFESWYGDDRHAAAYTQLQFPCAYIPGGEIAALGSKVDAFGGGDLLMTLPPLPYRCPPSPYERAVVLGWLLKSRKVKGRLIVVDPNPPFGGFDRVFAEHYKEQIVYLPQAIIKRVDPFNRVLVTEFEDVRFDDAILMAPQQASDLVLQAGLLTRDTAGKAGAWAAQDPVHLHAPNDERVFLIGDLMGPVSPLFGAYPKSGHLAASLGRIAATEIAARARGSEPPRLLPDSTCQVYTSLDPEEVTRIDASYRFRGDGLIVQSVKQKRDPNPRGEDIAWAKSQFADFLAYRE